MGVSRVNILLNISFCISLNKENYTGLKRHEDEKMIHEIMNRSFKNSLV